MWIKCCIQFAKSIPRSLAAAVIFPFATIISFPKMLAIYLNPEIQSRHFTPMNRVWRWLPGYVRSPEPTIKRMKYLVTSRYKISVSYLRSQVFSHLLNGTVIFCFGCVSGLFLIMDTSAGASEASAFNHAAMWSKAIKILACIPSAVGMIETLVFPQRTHFISAWDEISFPFKRCCNRNAARLIDRLIIKANIGLGEIQRVKQILPRTLRSTLHRDLEQKYNTNEIKEALLNLSTLTVPIIDLIIEYGFPYGLFFSNEPLNLKKLKEFENLNQLKPESKEEFTLDIESIDNKIILNENVTDQKTNNTAYNAASRRIVNERYSI